MGFFINGTLSNRQYYQLGTNYFLFDTVSVEIGMKTVVNYVKGYRNKLSLMSKECPKVFN